jgi:mono/diheme cytochrome c family protein
VNIARADDSLVARGQYPVRIGGCNDCHTASYLLGKAEMSPDLGGGEVGFVVPGQGVFVAPNLTPDKNTGLGNWTKQEIVTAITTGVRPDGRTLAPVMPWRGYAALTNADAGAMAEFLKSLSPVVHKVPGPFGPNEKPVMPVMTIVPAAEAAQR